MDTTGFCLNVPQDAFRKSRRQHVSYFFKRQHRQLRLLLQQKSCLCCYCCYYISVVFQNPQAKNSSKNLKWQPAFRLVKVVFVVVNRQHRVHNQTVVPVVSVVVKTKAQKFCCRPSPPVCYVNVCI